MQHKFTVFTGNLHYTFCQRFSLLSYQQKSGIHKQSIYEKLNISPKPKKPLTPYFKFLEQVRPTLAKEFPDLKITELVKIAAQRWSTVDSNLKERLTQQYHEETSSYIKSKEQYEKQLTPDQRAAILQAEQYAQDLREERKVKKKSKDLGKPKRPVTSFLRYLHSRSNEKSKYPTPKDEACPGSKLTTPSGKVNQDTDSLLYKRNTDVLTRKQNRLKEYEPLATESQTEQNFGSKTWKSSKIKEVQLQASEDKSNVKLNSEKRSVTLKLPSSDNGADKIKFVRTAKSDSDHCNIDHSHDSNTNDTLENKTDRYKAVKILNKVSDEKQLEEFAKSIEKNFSKSHNLKSQHDGNKEGSWWGKLLNVFNK